MARLMYPENLRGPMLIFQRKQYVFGAAKANPDKTMSENVDKSARACCALYVPGGISDSYTAAWGPENVIPGTNMLAGGAGTTDAIIGGLKNQGLASVQSGIGGKVSGNLAASMSAVRGSALVPNQLLIYGGPEFSQLSLNFEMVPRSSTEASTISSIVALFKEVMTSRTTLKDSTVATIDYPYIFDIKLSNQGKKMSTDYSYTDMALTSCTVNYGQGGTSTTFFENGAHPVSTNIQLSFKAIKLFNVTEPGKSLDAVNKTQSDAAVDRSGQVATPPTK